MKIAIELSEFLHFELPCQYAVVTVVCDLLGTGERCGLMRKCCQSFKHIDLYSLSYQLSLLEDDMSFSFSVIVLWECPVRPVLPDSKGIFTIELVES